MDFNIIIDDTANENLPGVTTRNSGVTVTDTDLTVHLGPDFNTTIPLTSVTSAEPMPDPRPEVYLVMGVSAAVDKLGRDTVCVVGSYDGLVVVHFSEMVQANVRPTGPGKDAPTDEGTIKFQHLILSLEDADGFLNAINQGAQRGGAEPISSSPASVPE